MIVSYDLRYASDHFPGVGTVTYWLLVESLRVAPADSRFVVFWNPALPNRRFDLDPIRRSPRVEWVEAPELTHDIAGQWRLGRELRRLRPSVHFSPFYLMPVAAGCPVVLMVHDVIPLRLPETHPVAGRWAFRLALWAAKGARGIVTVSEFSRDEIRALTGIGRVAVTRPGSAPARAGDARPPRVPDAPFALVVGINKPHKNLDGIAAAWARLGPHPPLHLVGAGPEDRRYPGLASHASRHGAQSVHALGPVSEDELAWLYWHATLLLLPSTYEGFGLPLAESFAYGIPAIVSDIRALREIGDGVAVFVPAQDPDAWAREVLALSSDPTRLEALGRAAHARAADLTYRRTAEAVWAELVKAAGSSA